MAEIPTESIRETVLFVVPNNAEVFLAALAVMQSFERRRKSWKGIHVMGTPGSLIPQLDTLKSETSVLHVGEIPLDADLSFVFDVNRAYRLSLVGERSCVEVFGIMLGTEAASPLPELRVPSVEEKDQVLCLDQGIEQYVKNLKMGYVTSTEPNAEELMESSIVVGYRSFYTYAALSMGKAVVELYPMNECHKGWLSKLGVEGYYMIPTPNRKEFDVDILERTLRIACHYRWVASEFAVETAVEI